MLTSWSALLPVIGVIVVLAAGVTVVVVLLVRRSSSQPGRLGPVAAPGQAERNAAAGRLVHELDDAVARAGTSLHFARLQLSSDAPEELAAAVEEARASSAALAATLAGTRDGAAHGPAGTEVAGRLTSALARAESAHSRIAAAEARVVEETRRLEPPAR
ncbi:hypothetical protein [Oceanitalea stevensii]|uniref:Uncharacterized protein n=1 Tax=Oceanitalea stevensii TaxID=2763072 RepID=A0ABR8Z2A1_9MICO|nr:hypothetical protein [Oceanitalea stevensii]MBD8061964.1 hypothetical protein [Oceanitalea stevensii]